jgi:hypothetical protein
MSLDSVCSIWSGRSAACSIKASASLNRSLIWQSPLSLLPAPAGLLRSTMQWQRHTCYTVGIAPPASATSALRGTSAILMMPSPLPPTPALPLTFGCLRSPDSRITPTVFWALCRHWTPSVSRGAADPAPSMLQYSQPQRTRCRTPSPTCPSPSAAPPLRSPLWRSSRWRARATSTGRAVTNPPIASGAVTSPAFWSLALVWGGS